MNITVNDVLKLIVGLESVFLITMAIIAMVSFRKVERKNKLFSYLFAISFVFIAILPIISIFREAYPRFHAWHLFAVIGYTGGCISIYGLFYNLEKERQHQRIKNFLKKQKQINMNSQTLSLIKNVITLVSGFLLGRAIMGVPMTTEFFDMLIGSIGAVGTLIWSIKDKSVTIEQWQGTLRRVAALIGGILFAKGLVTPEKFEVWIAAVSSLIPVIQGILTRKKAEQLAKGEISVMQLKGADHKK